MKLFSKGRSKNCLKEQYIGRSVEATIRGSEVNEHRIGTILNVTSIDYRLLRYLTSTELADSREALPEVVGLMVLPEQVTLINPGFEE